MSTLQPPKPQPQTLPPIKTPNEKILAIRAKELAVNNKWKIS